MYSCSTCGKKVEVSPNGDITRTCDHTTKIVMNLQCTLYGEGIANDSNETNKLLAYFQKIGKSVIEKYLDVTGKK